MLSSTQSFLAFETPCLSRTSWLCRINGIVTQRAQLVLKTRYAHHMHFRFFVCLKRLGWGGLLIWDSLWAGPPSWTPVSYQGRADLFLKALPAVFHPKEIQHVHCRTGPWLWAKPRSWGRVGDLASEMHYRAKLKRWCGHISSPFLPRGTRPIFLTGSVFTTIPRWRQESCFRSNATEVMCTHKVNTTASQKLFVMIQLDFQGGFKTF